MIELNSLWQNLEEQVELQGKMKDLEVYETFEQAVPTHLKHLVRLKDVFNNQIIVHVKHPAHKTVVEFDAPKILSNIQKLVADAENYRLVIKVVY